MRKDGNLSYNRFLVINAVLFFVLVVAYSGFMLYMTAYDSKAVWISFAFIVLSGLLGGAMFWTLRRKIGHMIETVDHIVDGAISGEQRLTGYTETNISSLENKVVRYINLAKTRETSMEAEKSNIKALISDISHQTKTPLSNIILYSGLLEESPLQNEEARQYAAQIKAQSVKLDWLIQSLIKMSRLETGVISTHAVKLPVIRTITGALSQVYSKAERKGIDISISCEESLQANHDPKWTGEALVNLLENAVKYSEPGGTIQIKAQTGEMFIRIDITDTGIGIDESEWNAIFKRFYRSKQAAKYDGVGIGLYLTREIITAQGGYIKVSSKLGEGSVFSVFLPAI